MKTQLNALLFSGLAATCIAPQALADNIQALPANTADAQLVLTFTLDQVLLNGSAAQFETSDQAGDILFEDVGPNGNTSNGGRSGNPPGSIGGGSASISYSLNGIDPFVGNYDQDSFGIGDSLVMTMNASASATTPGSLFFAQVTDEATLYFSTFGGPTDQFTFQFSYDAELTGTLDNTAFPGDVALALAQGNAIFAEVESPESGPGYSFDVFSGDDPPYFQFFDINSAGTQQNLNDTTNGSFDVVFAPGDNGLSITFDTNLVVNAEVIPEPGSLALLGLGGLLIARRRR